MPRQKRRIIPGTSYHVVNRGNDKRVIFRGDADYEHFLDLMIRGRERADVHVRGFCLMSTHFHLLLEAGAHDALPAYMHWVTCRYACEFRRSTDTLGFGHVFQHRYFAAPIDDALGALTVLAYIEGNPQKAGLVARAEDWKWSSLRERTQPRLGLISREGDVPCLPENWTEMVNMPWRAFLEALVIHDLRRRAARRMGRFGSPPR